MDNKENSSHKFANFMGKAADIGKKAAKDLSEQTQKTLLEQRTKYYNPLFRETFFSSDFNLPNIIQIVDDAVRRGVDVCEGAIGWTKKVGGVEILFIYDEFVKESSINFLPFVKCDAVYSVDNFNRKNFINTEFIFERSMNEKMAELENVAYSLGAKSCSIEMVEANSETSTASAQATLGIKNVALGTELSSHKQGNRYQGGKNISYFEGNKEPTPPTLKWFAYDDNIKNLINMRCSGDYTIKSKVLIFNGASSATMSTKSAAAIDIVSKVKGNISMEKQAIKEHSTMMVLEIEF